jgi:hypothetical protein
MKLHSVLIRSRRCAMPTRPLKGEAQRCQRKRASVVARGEGSPLRYHSSTIPA